MIPLRYNARSLVRRRTTTIAAALGMALVVFVLAASMMLSSGIRKTLVQASRPNVAIVLRKGSDAELASGVEKAHVALVAAREEVARDPSGQPLAVGEVEKVLDFMRREHASVLTEIRTSKKFEGEVADKTKAALEAFGKQFA